ncbi:hypothetical protein [Dactylosporangium sp. CA-233914]|uniref:hypothetical protein n=1 Tax=Dactylosporangium sp. CA-233914 TaxID=3239934 RepID=UPI003D931EA5
MDTTESGAVERMRAYVAFAARARARAREAAEAAKGHDERSAAASRYAREAAVRVDARRRQQRPAG